MSLTVKIPWNREFEPETHWNTVFSWAIEYFGLPGDRFNVSLNVNDADFIFESEKDAILMSLRWNVEIVKEHQ